MTKFQKIAVVCSSLMIVLAGCSFLSKSAPAPGPGTQVATKKGGGYYQDDGPGRVIPASVETTPNAIPKQEPLHKYANRPYSIAGKRYTPMKSIQPFTQTGEASWYGKQFHGRKTASGEVYNMYAMTAAHPTLPIPSYVKVTNPSNGREVVVRINDRGPFHGSRVIDLSYSAAHRLGFIQQGKTKVHIEQIVMDGPTYYVDNQQQNQPAVMRVSTASATAVAEESDLLSFLIADAQAIQEANQSGSFMVQVGAYKIRDNADLMDLNLKIQFDSLTGKTRIVQKDDLYRVWIGPFPDKEDAVSLADQITDRYGFKAIVIDE